MGYVIQPDGTTVAVSPENGTHYTLEEMQEYVGGYIEIVPLPTELRKANVVMICDEEFLLKINPDEGGNTMPNLKACMLSRDTIFGAVLVCSMDEDTNMIPMTEKSVDPFALGEVLDILELT